MSTDQVAQSKLLLSNIFSLLCHYTSNPEGVTTRLKSRLGVGCGV